jgi:hypothetical protein
MINIYLLNLDAIILSSTSTIREKKNMNGREKFSQQHILKQHEKAFDLLVGGKWRELVSCLAPIIPELEPFTVVNSSNAFYVRFYADCHFLIAHGYYHLGQYQQAMQHALTSANTRKMIPANLRLPRSEDDNEQKASFKLYSRSRERCSHLQGNSLFTASNSGSNSDQSVSSITEASENLKLSAS